MKKIDNTQIQCNQHQWVIARWR